jgi:transcriptional regulator with XRE-family HTH domain
VDDPIQRSEPKRLAALVDHLFATRRHPSGREYRLSEVSAATGERLTVAWLSLLRKGGIARPGADKIQLLADFFGVDASYFTGKQPRPKGDAEPDEELRRAMAQPLVREMALRASQLDEEDQERLLKLVEHALALGARARRRREKAQSMPDAVTDDEESEDEL